MNPIELVRHLYFANDGQCYPNLSLSSSIENLFVRSSIALEWMTLKLESGSVHGVPDSSGRIETPVGPPISGDQSGEVEDERDNLSLSEDQRDFLVAAMELRALDSDTRKTAEDIVRQAKGDYADPPNAKKALSDLYPARP